MIIIDEVSSAPDDARDRLIVAATEVFAERGYDGAGVQEIARRAGLTTGAIYGRFRGKDDLLLEAIDACVPEEIERLLSGQVDDDATAIIAQLGSHLVDSDPAHPASVLLEAIVASQREDALAERLSIRLGDDRLRLVKLIDEAKAADLIDNNYDTDTLATFCNAVSFGMLVTKSLDRDLPDHRDWDHLIGALVVALAPASPDDHQGDPT